MLKEFDSDEDEEQTVEPMYINKAYDEREASAYREITAYRDPVSKIIPTFHGTIQVPCNGGEGDRTSQGGTMCRYVRLGNLLRHFSKRPHVMDCKIGTRSYSEEEVEVTKPRKDLFERLVDLDASFLTPEERSDGACTKYRWMSFNDAFTGLTGRAFRIDGISRGLESIDKTEIKRQNTSISTIRSCIMDHFLPSLPPEAVEGSKIWDTAQSLRRRAATLILDKLRFMRETMLESSFVKLHEFVGTSLLYIADAEGPKADVFWIDFAKTTPLPAGCVVAHRGKWELGNHEDGLLTGIDNSIECWEGILGLLHPAPRVSLD